MIPEYVETIREAIYYEFAKLISRRARDGRIDSKFVEEHFRAIRDGEESMSSILREWQEKETLPKKCVFCGTTENLEQDLLIPRSRGGDDKPKNRVWSCSVCNASRGAKGVFQWLGLEKKDTLPLLVGAMYLRQLYELHNEKLTLDVNKELIFQLCSKCRNDDACEAWDVVEKLSCFCLESAF
jgi:hypothetical protein